MNSKKTTEQNDVIIRFNNVYKKFYKTNALNNINLEIKKSSVVGLLGPNGAGKTTLLNLIMNIYPPNEGEITLLDKKLGFDDLHDIKQDISYISSDIQFYKYMKIGKFLSFVSKFYKKWDWDLCNRFMDELSLDNDKKIRNLSRGEFARLSLLVGFSHQPKILLIDEITSGLDPMTRYKILKTIIDLVNDNECTVIFASHIISDVERIADQICLIENGNLLIHNNIDDFRNEYRCFTFNTKHIDVIKKYKDKLIKSDIYKEFVRIFVTTKMAEELKDELITKYEGKEMPFSLEQLYMNILFEI